MMRVGTQRRSGQGMTEYIIVVGLIALLLVPVIGKTGLGGVLYETIVGTDKAIQDGIVKEMDRGGGGGLGNGSGSGNGNRPPDNGGNPDPSGDSP